MILSDPQIPLFNNERRIHFSNKSILLGGPSGRLTVVPGHTLWTLRSGRYKDWIKLLTIHAPLTDAIAQKAKDWAVRTYAC